MIASDEQISQPSLVWKQNSSHLHSLCVGILFNCTALGIHLCKTSQLYILKTRLGGEIYSSDVNMHKGYSICKPAVYVILNLHSNVNERHQYRPIRSLTPHVLCILRSMLDEVRRRYWACSSLHDRREISRSPPWLIKRLSCRLSLFKQWLFSLLIRHFSLQEANLYFSKNDKSYYILMLKFTPRWLIKFEDWFFLALFFCPGTLVLWAMSVDRFVGARERDTLKS